MTSYKRPGWLPEWISIAGDGRLSWYDGGARGVGTRHQKRCRTIDAAETEARKIINLATRSSGLSVSLGTSWKDLCQAWVDAHNGRINEGTLRRRFSVINAHLVPLVGTVPVAETSLATLMTVVDATNASCVEHFTFDSIVQTMCVVADWGRERLHLPADHSALTVTVGRRCAVLVVAWQLTRPEVKQDGNEVGITVDRKSPQVLRIPGLLSLSHFGRDVLNVVVGFELGGWDVAEFAEEVPVIEPVDPFESGEFQVLEARHGPRL